MAIMRTSKHIDPVKRILAHLVNDSGRSGGWKSGTISDAGSGYSNTPAEPAGQTSEITFSNTGEVDGSGLTGTAVISGGSISSINITNPGSGYVANDILNINQESVTPSTQATYTINTTTLFTDIADDLKSSGTHLVTFPRVYSETLKSWNKIDDNCKAITIAKQRFGSGKSAMDQTVEFAVEFICWTNRGVNEHKLWDLWAKVDTMFHDQHDYEIGNKIIPSGSGVGTTENAPLKGLHSYRFQEPSFELRFGSTSGSAVARLSSAQKLRLASLRSIYNFVGWEYQVS